MSPHEETEQRLAALNAELGNPTDYTYFIPGWSGRNRLGEMLMELRATVQPTPLPFFVPPWIKYPDIEPSDMHWRMGGGEDYLSNCSKWYNSLPEDVRHEYNGYFPTPPEWSRSWHAT